MIRSLVLLFLALACFSSDSFVPSFGLEYDKDKAKLGKKLFFDKRFNKNGNSCETCHNLYWDFSGTLRNNTLNNTLNIPTVLNAAKNYIFFSDGRVRNIHDQVKTSISSRKQLAVKEHDMVAKVSNIRDYRIAFSEIYKDGIKFSNIIDALVEFEKSIYTANSDFDKYLMGDNEAFNDEQIKGYNLFVNLGCVACHNGINLGSNLMQNVSSHKKITSDTSLKKLKKDMVRVPSLRNIARTAPYMSDGSILYLKDVIRYAAKVQLMRNLTKDETEYLYKFLLSLNGEYPRILQ